MLEKVENSMLIDKMAVYEEESGNYVYVIHEGKVEKRSVTLGKENEIWCEVLEGISQEETIILDAMTEAAIGKAAQAMSTEEGDATEVTN